MAVKTAYRTVIVCDGNEGFCPDDAVLDIGQPPNAAMRSAVKSGWQVGSEDLCPICQGSSRTATLPVRQMRTSATIHRFPARIPMRQFQDSPDCPLVSHQLTA